MVRLKEPHAGSVVERGIFAKIVLKVRSRAVNIHRVVSRDMCGSAMLCDVLMMW